MNEKKAKSIRKMAKQDFLTLNGNLPDLHNKYSVITHKREVNKVMKVSHQVVLDDCLRKTYLQYKKIAKYN